MFRESLACDFNASTPIFSASVDLYSNFRKRIENILIGTRLQHASLSESMRCLRVKRADDIPAFVNQNNFCYRFLLQCLSLVGRCGLHSSYNDHTITCDTASSPHFHVGVYSIDRFKCSQSCILSIVRVMPCFVLERCDCVRARTLG